MESRKNPTLELVDVTLETPHDRYQLGDSRDPGFAHISRPTMSIRARAPSLKVTLVLFAQLPQVLVEPDPRERDVHFEIEASFYQRDGGERVSLSGTQIVRRRGRIKLEPASLRLEMMQPLAGIMLNSDKVSLDMIHRIEELDGARHRFYVLFTIDGEPHLLDATFVVGTKREWYWGIPGTP